MEEAPTCGDSLIFESIDDLAAAAPPLLEATPDGLALTPDGQAAIGS